MSNINNRRRDLRLPQIRGMDGRIHQDSETIGVTLRTIPDFRVVLERGNVRPLASQTCLLGLNFQSMRTCLFRKWHRTL